MDALKKALALMAVLVVAIVPVCMADGADADSPNGLLIQQVNPKECEGVAVHNYGSSIVDMKDYVIADMNTVEGSSEGTLTFMKSIPVAPGETLVIASDWKEGNYFSNQDNIRFYGGDKADDSIVKSSKFSLSDSGDDVYLFKNGKIVDAVCYGKTVIENSGIWNGGAVDLKYALPFERYNGKDSNSSSDWATVGTKQYDFDPSLAYDATVTPFLFPESGGLPILQQLQAAEKSICIEMYQLMNDNVYALLCEKAKAGVSISLLLEGDSLDGGNYDSIADNLHFFKALSDLGCDIRTIGGTSYDRFDYVHAKFAIIDGDTTIVTSENWTTNNVNGRLDENPYDSGTKGNRGWGAVIESTGYAKFMMSVFENDSDMRYGDVKNLDKLLLNVKPSTDSYETPKDIDHVFESYTASVTPVLSCDNSYDALEYYVSNAKIRAYSQQQSLSSSYESLESGPLSFFNEAASKGVDTRLIFSDAVDKSEVKIINASSGIKAASMSSPYVHNKGVICDDFTWVSSVNWTPTSFNKNRETCVVIDSDKISEFFAQYLIQDFDRYYTYDGISAYFSEFPDKMESGKEYPVTVSVSPASGTYTYKWDLGDGSDVRTTSIGRIVISPADGTHTMKVTITNDDGQKTTVEKTYTVGATTPGTDPDTPSGTDPDSTVSDIAETLGDKLYIIIVVLILLISAVAAKAKGSSKNKKKGKKR